MKNFKRAEFACHCGCGFDTVDFELAEVLDDVREHFGRKITVVSGARCRKRNKLVGGADGSQHLEGKAADIKTKGVSPHTVYEYLVEKYRGRYGIGVYPTWVHVDTRGTLARWRG